MPDSRSYTGRKASGQAKPAPGIPEPPVPSRDGPVGGSTDRSYAGRILRRLGVLQAGDRLVRVKSWWPWWDGRYVCWPTMLVDDRGLGRATQSPVWDRTRFATLLRGELNVGTNYYLHLGKRSSAGQGNGCRFTAAVDIAGLHVGQHVTVQDEYGREMTFGEFLEVIEDDELRHELQRPFS